MSLTSATPTAALRAGLLLVLGAACSAPPLAEEEVLPVEASAPALVRRELAYDDVLRVDIFEHPELSTGETGRRVDYDGNVDLPLIGTLHVLGASLDEVRGLVQERALRYVKRATVSVTVVSYAPRLFFALGEVAQNGSLALTAPTTALQALAMAGGITRLGDREEVVVLRARADELAVLRFDARTPDGGGLFLMEPGDVLFVRESGAGTFQQQILPYLQGLAPPFAAAASLFIVTNND